MRSRTFCFPLHVTTDWENLNASHCPHQVASVHREVVSTASGVLPDSVVEVTGQPSPTGDPNVSRMYYRERLAPEGFEVFIVLRWLYRRVAEIEALGDLGLALKHGGEWKLVTQGVPFLGFVLYPDRMRVNRPGRKRFRAKLRAVRRLHESGVLDESGAQARLTALAAHVCTADDVNWRRVALGFHDFGSSFGWPKGDTPEPRPRGPRRQLEQHGQELPLDVSQQQEARKPGQESGLPRGALPRHEGGERMPPPTDGACSRSAVPATVDEASRKPPPGVEIPAEHGRENTPGGAATPPKRRP